MKRSSLISPRAKVFSPTALMRTVDRRGTRATIAIPSHIPVPHQAHLSAEGTLSWTWVSTEFGQRGIQKATAPQSRKMEARLAERFAALAKASNEQIRGFAERWGPLWYRPPQPIEAITESVFDWRRYASLMGAIIRCAVALDRGRGGTAEDWQSVCSWLNMPVDPGLLDAQSNHNRVYGISLVAGALNQWSARACGLNLIAVEKQRLVLRPLLSTLLAVIGLQAAQRLTVAQDKVACHHCPRIFTPKFRPRLGVRIFCPRCRKAGKPQMYAMRDYRARMAHK